MTLGKIYHDSGIDMTWNKALIYTSSFSYIGASVATLMGFPVMANLTPLMQAIFYLVMFAILQLSIKYGQLKYPLSAIYGILAMLSFSGIQRWIHYAGDMSILGPGMAAWDLALAVALLLDENPK